MHNSCSVGHTVWSPVNVRADTAVPTHRGKGKDFLSARQPRAVINRELLFAAASSSLINQLSSQMPQEGNLALLACSQITCFRRNLMEAREGMYMHFLKA